jgi:four helix bundle protein
VEKPHKNLDVWKVSMELCQKAYIKTSGFPQTEKYGLTGQIRRSAVSVPSNIAEGAGRQTTKEFVKFLHIVQGSLSELDTQLDIAKNVGFLEENSWMELDQLMLRTDKMLTALIRSKKNKQEGERS